MMKQILILTLLALPVPAADLLSYAEADGTIKTVSVEILRKESETELNARVRVGGRLRTLKIPTRRVVSFWRGSSDDVNQWSKSLAKGKRLMAAGQIETQGTVTGAEEMFIKVAFSTEKGTKGQEKTEAIAPWQNMYASFHLIEARYRIGKNGKAAMLQTALSDIEAFERRSASKYGKKVDMEVPGQEGTLLTKKIYCWGASRLKIHVMVYKARILGALGKADEATAAYDAAIQYIKKTGLSPILLTDCVMEKAELGAKGQESEQQETLFRNAGMQLSGLVGGQPDAFGKNTLRGAANRALLRGADLLLDSAGEGKLSYDPPLERYRTLKEEQGSRDPALFMGAQAGIGICLTEKGEGKKAYEALLDVVVRGHEYPDQMARALYYLAKAAPLYAKEIDAAGGRGDFLRTEAARWSNDLQQRYPTSEWASKARSK